MERTFEDFRLLRDIHTGDVEHVTGFMLLLLCHANNFIHVHQNLLHLPAVAAGRGIGKRGGRATGLTLNAAVALVVRLDRGVESIKCCRDACS